MRPFVLEGGSIDTDGKGTLLTTKSCLCSLNRNEYLTQDEIEGELKQAFGLERVIWLGHGSIAGMTLTVMWISWPVSARKTLSLMCSVRMRLMRIMLNFMQWRSSLSRSRPWTESHTHSFRSAS